MQSLALWLAKVQVGPCRALQLLWWRWQHLPGLCQLLLLLLVRQAPPRRQRVPLKSQAPAAAQQQQSHSQLQQQRCPRTA